MALDVAEIRPPAIAGTFYPADPGQLTRMVDEALAHAPAFHGAAKAVISPHAGFVYSGAIAGSAYAAVIPAFVSCLQRGEPCTIFGDGAFLARARSPASLLGLPSRVRSGSSTSFFTSTGSERGFANWPAIRPTFTTGQAAPKVSTTAI